MKNSKFLIVTMAVTIIYCCLCFVSSGCILYGSFYDSYRVFQFGNFLMYLWMFNPIVIILSVIGLILRQKNWGKFILCVVLSIISWVVAGTMVAVRF